MKKIIPILFFVLILASSAYAYNETVSLNGGLKLYIDFENATATNFWDISGNIGFAGNVTGTTPLGNSAVCQNTSCYTFGGTDSILRYGKSTCDVTTNSFCLAYWATEDAAITGERCAISKQETGSPDDDGYYSCYKSTTYYIKLGVNDGTDWMETADAVGHRGYSVHVVNCFNRTNGTMEVYINGTKQAVVKTGSGGAASQDMSNGNDFLIGAYRDGTLVFKGYIDNVGFWSRLLNDGGCSAGQVCGAEIAQLFYNQSICNPVKSPQGCGYTSGPTTSNAFTKLQVSPPENNSQVNIKKQTIYYNVTWNSTLGNLTEVRLYIDGNYSGRNTTAVVSGANSSFPNVLFNISNDLGARTPNWSIKVIDDNGYSNMSSNYSFILIQAPNIFLLSPQDAYISNQTTEDLYFNATIFGATATNLRNISLYIDGKYNKSNTTAMNNNLNNSFTGINFRNTNATQNHTWSIKVHGIGGGFDTVNGGSPNSNMSNNFTVQTVKNTSSTLTVALSSPPDGGFSYVESPEFWFNVSSPDGIRNISLYIDGEYNRSNTTAKPPYQNNSFLGISLQYGKHNWSIKAEDINNVFLMSSNFSVEVYFPNPNVTLIAPTGGWIGNYPDGNTYEFRIDTYYSILNVSLFIDGEYNRSNTTAIIIGASSFFGKSNLSEGKHNWSIKAEDSYHNTTMSSNASFELYFIPPNSTDYSPSNNTFTNQTIFDLSFNSSSLYFIKNISLYINGVYNSTLEQTPYNNTEDIDYNANFSNIGFSDGTYYWSVEVEDYYRGKPSKKTMSNNFTLYVDTTPPNVASQSIENKVLLEHHNLTGWVNVTGTNLYGVLIYDNVSGIIANTTGITKTSSNNSININTSNYTGGQQDLIVYAYDAKAAGQYINKYNTSFAWYLIDNSSSATSSGMEGSFSEYYLNLTRVTQVKPQAVFYLNGSMYVPILINVSGSPYIFYLDNMQLPQVDSGNQTTFTFGWFYNVSVPSTENYDYANFSKEVTVYRMIIDNCSNYTKTRAINFTMYDADTKLLVENYTLQMLFTIWDETNPSFTKIFNFSYSEQNYSNGICIYPSTANYAASYNVIFSKSGYYNRQIINPVTKLNSTMETVDVYLTPTGITITTITINVVDEFDNKLTGYQVEAWKYDLSTNTYTLIDSQVVDSEGQVNFDLDTAKTNEYKFVVKNKLGTEVYTQPKQRIIQTDYTFIVVLGEIKEMTAVKISDLNIKLRAYRGTKTFNLEWNSISPTATSIRFTVTNRTSSTSQTLYNITSSSTTGTASYTITHPLNNNSGYYMASVFVTSSDDNKEYIYDSATMEFREEYTLFGIEALFAAFLIVGSLAMMGMQHGQEISAFMAIFGLIISIKMGFLILGLSSLMSLIVAFVVYMIKARAR